ncbi:MAG TPA: sugar phosphate isomerase/epimerase family protein [Verrucomicrobiales bacterium]|nr:sugar phosphate isomerase/epimerase family protein [Verrucomicrobiales bacterium]
MQNDPPEFLHPRPGGFSRREILRAGTLAATTGVLAAQRVSAQDPGSAESPAPDPRRASPKRYERMKKSINQWAFPYPERMNLRECLQLAKNAGFDGIELNYDLENDLSPKAGAQELAAIRRMAEDIGIQISGLCSFLFWPYPLTSNDEAKRARGLELAGQIASAASQLGVENVLLVPGAVHIPWRDDHSPVPNDVCDARAKEAVGKLLLDAEKLGVSLNIENIFFNGYLMTPFEMNAFVDHFDSAHCRVHFDTGNIMEYQFPEHWARLLGKRTKNVHLKEYSKKGTDHSLECFRPLLDGTTNWPAVVEALDQAGYEGFLTFEYFHPWQHYPEALIHQTSDALDRMLGRV